MIKIQHAKISKKSDLSKIQIEKRLKEHRLIQFMDFKSDIVWLELIQLIFKTNELNELEINGKIKASA